MTTGRYSLDKGSGVWRRAGHAGIGYSDGAEHERYLLDVLRGAADLSAYSDELVDAIRDWPSEYHLTPLRHNLLRPFAFDPQARVLELGAGCGAMTRYLAENFHEVVSVEGSFLRASAAAARCRDLDNVSIYCDRIGDFEPGRTFDYVFVVGVLEYAPVYGTGPDPVAHFLRQAVSMLGESGSLVLAIENKLGLKYFAGCAEDHHGIPFYGVSDLYPSGTPKTFGRRELAAILRRAGLASQQLHLPFPDYKLPTMMLAEAALDDPELNVPDLLLTVPSRDYQDDQYRCFDEGLAWRSLHANGLLADFANSLLVIAGRQQSQPAVDWLCKSYNRSARARALAVETTISRRDPAGALEVSKKLLHPARGVALETTLPTISHELSSTPYIHGSLLLGSIREAMAREEDFGHVADAFEPWISLLREQAAIDTEGHASLPGSFVDCVPFNVIRETASGRPRYFDAEWVVEGRIPLAWVFIRGAVYAVGGAMWNRNLETMTHRAFVARLALHHGISLRPGDFAKAAERERVFSAHCGSGQRAIVDLLAIYDDLLYARRRFGRMVWTSEAERVKATVSWRITAPLRVAWNAWNRARKWLGGDQGKMR